MARPRYTRTVAAGAIALAICGAAPQLASAVGQPAAAKDDTTTTKPAETAGEPIIEVTSQNLQQAKDMAKERPVVFLVTAPAWCHWCQKLDPVIRKLANAGGGKWTLAIIDADKAGGADKEFHVQGFPTMVPWGKDGELKGADRFVGYDEEPAIKKWIDKVQQSYGGSAVEKSVKVGNANRMSPVASRPAS